MEETGRGGYILKLKEILRSMVFVQMPEKTKAISL